MRRIFLPVLPVALIAVLLLAWPHQAAIAAERVVRLTVPGCAS